MAARKTLSFAVVHFTVAFSVTWALTGSAALGGLIALIEPLVNTVAYYAHESLWLRLASRLPAASDTLNPPLALN